MKFAIVAASILMAGCLSGCAWLGFGDGGSNPATLAADTPEPAHHWQPAPMPAAGLFETR